MPIYARRRFRFSLRSLLIWVTLAAIPCGWAAYQLDWIRQRRAFLAHWKSWQPSAYYSEELHMPFCDDDYRPSLPISLRMFGERGIWEVSIPLDGPTPDELTDTDRRRLKEAKRLFPESPFLFFVYRDLSGTWMDKAIY